MDKNGWQSRLEQALLVLLVMVGAIASAALDVRAVASAMAAGKHGVVAGTMVAGQASAASAAPSARVTIVARAPR